MMDNQKERDRSRRGDRPSRFSDAARDRSHDRGSKRLFVSNIPYEYRWTELKDLFKEKVGDVAYVELFNDENGKHRGCGVVEFTNTDAMKKALEVMHRFELKGRKLVLKEETAGERNRLNPARSGGGGGGGGGAHRNREEKDLLWGAAKPREVENFNTYGLSLQFLDSINIKPPLMKRIFVANLDYKADAAKIKEIFKMAGKVRNIDLALDKDGNSRGFAVIEYDHPVEAVQAISMFDKQLLYDRKMSVRMDKSERNEFKLPEGLKGIGLGLGPNGEPLRDVARNLPSASNNSSLNLPNTPSTNFGTGVLGGMQNTGVSLNGLGAGLTATSLGAANTALTGGLTGLQALNLSGLGALQNQLLQQGLTANDIVTALNLNNQAANVNTGSLGIGNTDLGSSVLGNPGMGGVLGSASNSLGPGSLTGGNRSLNPVSVPSQSYSRDTSSQQTGREKPTDMVVITNLPPTVTWQLIREKFSECGDVKFAEMTAQDTAIVRFHSEWDAERAIKMFDRTRIDGRTIDVRYF